jgi:hypothetical protein
MRYLLVVFFISSPIFSQLLIQSVEFQNQNSTANNSVKSAANVFENNAERKLKGSFTLHQNYPNPFNPTTTISYEIKETSYIELRIYDALGRFIKTADEGIKIPGTYKVLFEPENLSAGVYFYQLISGEYKTQNKMLLLK